MATPSGNKTIGGKLLDFGKAVLMKRHKKLKTNQCHLENLADELSKQIKALPGGPPFIVSNIRHFLRSIEFQISARDETREKKGGRS